MIPVRHILHSWLTKIEFWIALFLVYGTQQMVPNGQYFKLLPEGRSPAESSYQPHSHWLSLYTFVLTLSREPYSCFPRRCDCAYIATISMFHIVCSSACVIFKQCLIFKWFYPILNSKWWLIFLQFNSPKKKLQVVICRSYQ